MGRTPPRFNGCAAEFANTGSAALAYFSASAMSLGAIALRLSRVTVTEAAFKVVFALPQKGARSVVVEELMPLPRQVAGHICMAGVRTYGTPIDQTRIHQSNP
jgi:hypothetical protein